MKLPPAPGRLERMPRSLLVVLCGTDPWPQPPVLAEADAVIFDLSDIPDSGLPDARLKMEAFVKTLGDARSALLLVAINAAHAEARLQAELAAAMALRPAGIWATVCNGAALQKLDVLLSVEEVELGLPLGGTKLFACCDPAGLLAISSIAGKSERLAAIGWDPSVLAGSLGGSRFQDAENAWTAPMALARSMTLVGASAAGVASVDHAPPGAKDEALQTACLASRADGYDAMLTRQPDQLATIKLVFS